MASGYGLRGGPSRCFPFWQEVMACYVLNSTGDDNSGAGKCMNQLEDYHECLHHQKEAKRIAALTKAYQKKETQNPREDAPTAGQIRSLGLIEATMEEKHLKVSKWLPHVKNN